MLTWGMRAPSSCVSIFELAHLPADLQPEVTCFECGVRLVPRLGQRRKFHFAHPQRAGCYATTAAGEAHLQAKLHLFAQLSSLARVSGRLSVGLSCEVCGGALISPLCDLGAGDTVRLLRRHIGPDVALLRADGPRLWIDVAAGPPERERWADGDAAIPRVEVAARAVCDPAAGGYWTPDRALPAARHRGVAARCPPCRGLPGPLAVAREFAGPLPSTSLGIVRLGPRAEDDERVVRPLDIWRLFARYDPPHRAPRVEGRRGP